MVAEMSKKDELMAYKENGEKFTKTCSEQHHEALTFVPFQYSIPLLALCAHGTLKFALKFPFILWHKGATDTYVRAWYQYDELNTKFDNTIWTYGTDYGIALFMLIGAVSCWTCVQNYTMLRFLNTGLLSSYCISVLFGGYAHHTFLTLDSLNTTSFKIIWIVCVGTVTLAGGFIGAIGTELGKSLYGMNKRISVPLLPHYFWALWGIYLTTVCAMGGISFKRPACDIFVAGTTQSFPTFYTISVVLSRYWEKTPMTAQTSLFNFSCNLQSLVSKSHRYVFTLSFLLNAPLLPAYPVLLSLGFALGTVNAICHGNLTLAWGLQYWSLWRFSIALQETLNSGTSKRV